MPFWHASVTHQAYLVSPFYVLPYPSFGIGPAISSHQPDMAGYGFMAKFGYGKYLEVSFWYASEVSSVSSSLSLVMGILA